ncbi:hypothetical protein ACFFHJ_39650 [Planotetraspora thailandica]|uniref:hypothetical protein n=1 Tax=Planotetraspora thailandica TaxID=487172 RepID=UPI00194F1DCB|nr:hypothetical protein [Planotetraspora thailandica]
MGTALVTCVLLGISVATAQLHSDIRYVLACLRTGGVAGFSPSETFTHRPFFYRWFVAGLNSLTPSSIPVGEMIVRLAGVALCVAAGLLLRAALQRHLSTRDATLTAVVVALSLAFAPRIDYLQPEWTATLLSVVAVALVLMFDRPWVAAAVASLPLGLTVMMKYSTAATAMIALLVVFAVDRRRAILLAVATAVSGVALLGLSFWAGSHEWQWAQDMPKINRQALTRQAIDPGFLLHRSIDYLADRAVLSPMLALFPAALVMVLMLAREVSRRRRVEWAALAVLITLGCIAAVAFQGNWFPYHSAALPVCAAAVWALAVARWYGVFGRPPLLFIGITVLLGALVPFTDTALKPLLTVGTVWLAAAVAVLAGLADLRLARRRAPRHAGARPQAAVPMAAVPLLALAGIICLAAPIWPGSPNQMGRGHVITTNADYWKLTEDKNGDAAEVNREIPQGAPVLYLAFGDMAYFVQHPVQCRYPIPTFLQREQFLPDVKNLTSTKENALCVTGNPADYAVLQRSWFPLAQVDKKLTAEIKANFNCPKSVPNNELVVCHRR